MKLTERVLNEEKRNLNEKKRRDQFWQDEEDAQGYMYEDAPKWIPLNSKESAFTNKDDKSINTAESIFDRTAIFRVGTGDN